MSRFMRCILSYLYCGERGYFGYLPRGEDRWYMYDSERCGGAYGGVCGRADGIGGE